MHPFLKCSRILKGIFIGVFAGTVLSTIVLLLWNWLMPTLFGLQVIGFWQAAGLFLLSRILFSPFRCGGKHHRHHQFAGNALRHKWMNMTEEERTEFMNRRFECFHKSPFDKGDCCTEKNSENGK